MVLNSSALIFLTELDSLLTPPYGYTLLLKCFHDDYCKDNINDREFVAENYVNTNVNNHTCFVLFLKHSVIIVEIIFYAFVAWGCFVAPIYAAICL